MNVAHRGTNRGGQLLTLLQLSSASFPTGAFSHSYGFETWLAANEIGGPAEAEERALTWLRFTAATGDGVAVCAAHRLARAEDFAGLARLNADVNALKLTRETREASTKTAAAWIAACRSAVDCPPLDTLVGHARAGGWAVHHSVAFGVTLGGLGFPEGETVETYLFTSFTNLVSVLARLVPIGQGEVQRIIADAQPRIEAAAEVSRTRGAHRMSSTYSSLDIASMRHERLVSRLCIS